MALVRVKTKKAVNGEHPETEVSEEWLERWPDDFTRIDKTDTGVQAPAPIDQQTGGNPVPNDQTAR